MTIRYGASTDIGRVRETNEDSILHKPPVFAVADGMGGHRAGDVASQTALSILGTADVADAASLIRAVRAANSAVFERSRAEAGTEGMGTTLTALFAANSRLAVAHVGDSRAYLFRDAELNQITRDHTVVERLVEQGRISREEAERHPQRSYLERALGVDVRVEVDSEELEVAEGDRVMLCSDGLYGMLDVDDIATILAAEQDPQSAADRLCSAAVEAGGVDNVSVIVIDFGPSSVAVANPPTTSKVSRRRRVTKMAAVLVTFLGLLGVGQIALRGSWYVGESDGKVAVFRGIPGRVAGFELSHVEEVTDLQTDSLTDHDRRTVQEGIPVKGQEDAAVHIQRLRKLARTTLPAPERETLPTPTPTP